jgi:hypothetical protein
MKRALALCLCLLSAGLLLSAQTWTTLRPLMGLQGRTDENGALYAYATVAGSIPGPLTALSNLQGRTDENGALNVTVSGGVLTPTTARLSEATITAGSGTGITVNEAGAVRQQVYKVTVAYTAWGGCTAATTCDLTIGTLPAKTFITHILADLTVPFTCSATCGGGTMAITVGTSAGGTQLLASADVKTAAAVYGDATAELGSGLTEATIPTPLGALGSWTTTTPVSVRLTSGSGNLAANVNAGNIVLYVTTIRY